MFWILFLPFRLLFGTSKLTFRTGYRAGRLIGVSRLAAFGVGVGVGLLIAPTPGAELRERLRRRLEESRTPLSDGEIAARVREELAQSPRTWHLPQPEVQVVGGRAVLTGQAPHPSGKADIERTVASVAGVVAVDNRLVVETPR